MKPNKDERNVLRLILSSLFARRQKYLWMSSKNTDVVYFSTMGSIMPFGKKTGKKTPPMGPVYMYKPTVDDFVHKVTFKNDSFTNALKNVFPYCKIGNTCITVVDFNSTLNKGLLDNLIYTNDDTETVLYEKEVKNRPTVKNLVATKVGDHMFGIISNYYANFERNVLCNENVSVVSDDVVHSTGSNLSYVEIDFGKLPKINSDYLLKIPICEGLNSICKSEYCKRSKLEGTTNIHLAPNKQAVGLVIVYEDDFVKVESVQPVSLWFPKMV